MTLALLALGQLALVVAFIFLARAVSHLRRAVEAQGTRLALHSHP